MLGLLQFACARSAPTPTTLSSDIAEPSPKVAAPLLEPGKAVERELEGTHPDEIPLSLEANQYVRLILDQKQLNVTARLLDASGTAVATAEGLGGWQAPVLLSLVTTAGGQYRLVVTASDHGAAKDLYTVKLDELRPARPEDGDRVKAETALSEAIRLRLRGQEGDLSTALDKANESLSLWKQIQDPAGEIKAFLELADIHNKNNDRVAMRTPLEDALSLSLAIHDPLGEAKALWRQAAFVDLGPERQAKLDRALEISRQLGETGEQAQILYETGFFEFSQGDFPKALISFQEALGLAQSAARHRLEPDIWNGIGAIYAGRGESGEALKCYERALDLVRQEGEPGTEAAILTSIGSLLRRRGELQKALQQLSTALDLNERDKDLVNQAKVLLHLGGVHRDLGDTDQALKYYEKALGLFRSVHDRSWEGTTLFQIGQVYLAREEWQSALQDFEQAKIIAGENGHTARQAAALHGIGVVRLNLGQTKEAIQSLAEALPLRQKAGDRPGEASTLRELGEAYRKQGDVERAVSLMQQALRIAREAEASFLQAATLLGLARIERDRGNLTEALTEIQESIKILESVRSNLTVDRLRSSFFASRRSYYDFYVDLLMRLDRRFPGQGYEAQALEASERARARSLLDLLAQGRLDLTRGIPPDLKQREVDVTARLSQIQIELMDELSKKQPDEDKVSDLHAQLDEVESERQELEWKIHSEYPRYYEARYPSILGLAEIQKRLDKDSVLLEYSLGEDGSYLFVVTRESLEVHPLQDAKRLGEEVWTIRKALEESGRRSFSSYVRTAYRLYQELIAPARAGLSQKRYLLISPDGPLHFLAFEALLTEPEDGRAAADLPYLLRDVSVSYIPSASVLSWLSAPQSAAIEGSEPSKQFVAFADPVYGPEESQPPAEKPVQGLELRSGSPTQERGLGPVPRLAGTAREVAKIATLYPSADVELYEGGQATEENVKGNPIVENARRLHFATHGVLNERRPELSGLRLTRTTTDDGILQVHEIYSLNLKAELVVLSACDTGSGKEVVGEGLVGMTRAFLYAGAPSIVVSLWQVTDAQAPDFMLRFYNGLNQTRNKAEALREAKLEMIRGREWAKPYYWAPFILVGKP